MSIFGNAEQRLAVLCAVVSFMVLVWGVYRLTRIAFTPLVAAIAVALLMTRFNFMFLAARGYVDSDLLRRDRLGRRLEIERPRRGTLVFAVLLVAELIRPDAWLLGGPLLAVVRAEGQPLTAVLVGGDHRRRAVGVGRARLDRHRPAAALAAQHAGHRRRARAHRAVVAAARHVDALPDRSDEVGGRRGRDRRDRASSAWLVPRRMAAPLVVLFSGIGTFVVLAGAGLSVIDRYLLMPAVMILLIFCAFALSGWTMLERGLLRRVWALGALVLAGIGVYLRRQHSQRRQDRDRARLPQHRPDLARRDPA